MAAYFKNILLLLFCFFSPITASAQNFLSLTDPPVIAKKTTQRTSEVFDLVDSARTPQEAKANMGKAMESVAALFNLKDAKMPNGVGTYEVIPNCTAPLVRHAPVVYDSDQLSWFDMVVYSYRDSAQVARAEAWERPTAPFLEGDLFNPYRLGDLQQEFLRVFRVRCLPTRFRYVTVNGERLLEYREGDRAWDTAY